MMKVLIWFLCLLVATVLNMLLGYFTGIMVGYFIFYIAVFFVARALCRKWDEHKAKIEYKPAENVSLSEDFSAIAGEIRFCRKCGERLLDSSNFCRKCGTEIQKE